MFLEVFIESVWPAVIIWFLVAVLAVFVETSTAQMVSIWFAISAVVTCIISAFGAPFWLQLTVFGLCSLGLFFASRPFARKINSKKTSIEGTAEGLVNEIVTVVKEFSGDDIGSVKARYDVYSAMCLDNSSFEKGEKVKVVSIEGNKLIVSKFEK